MADEKAFVWLVEAMEIPSLLAGRMMKLVMQGLVSE